MSDYVSGIILAGVVVYILGKNHGFTSFFTLTVVGSLLLAAGFGTYWSFYNFNDTADKSAFVEVMNDNTMLTVVLAGIIAWYLVRV